MIGARVGTRNRPWAYWTAVNSPPNTKKICAGSTSLVRRATSVSCAASRRPPDPNSQPTTRSAASAAATVRATMSTATGPSTALKASRAPAPSPLARYLLRMGMNVMARKPPASR